MLKRGPNSLRFSSIYSATSQRKLLGDGWLADDFLIHLRIDSLRSENIVLPDVYVLDGCYFLDKDPEDLRRLIGRGTTDRRLPIQLPTRRSSLAESLRWLLVREDKNTLNAFPFYAIADENLCHCALLLGPINVAETCRRREDS